MGVDVAAGCVLEALGLAELECNARNNWVRAR
jgi:hypothetical protein